MLTKSQMKAQLIQAKKLAKAKKSAKKDETAFKLEMAKIEYDSRDDVMELQDAVAEVEMLLSIVSDVTRPQPQYNLGSLVNQIVSLAKTIMFTKGANRAELDLSMSYKSNLIEKLFDSLPSWAYFNGNTGEIVPEVVYSYARFISTLQAFALDMGILIPSDELPSKASIAKLYEVGRLVSAQKKKAFLDDKKLKGDSPDFGDL